MLDKKGVLLLLTGFLLGYLGFVLFPTGRASCPPPPPTPTCSPCLPCLDRTPVAPQPVVPEGAPLPPRTTLGQILVLQQELMDTFKIKNYSGPGSGLEGHSGQFPQKLLAYRALTYGRNIKTICETGFNLGHSAVAWLASNPGAHLYSFDFGSHAYREIGIDMCNRLFPGRLTMTTGDSTKTVPEFFKTHANVTCDLVHVDGGHSYEVAMADLRNLGARVSEGGLLLIDDTNCKAGYCVDKAWNDYLRETRHAMPIISVLDVPNALSGVTGAYMNRAEPRTHDFF